MHLGVFGKRALPVKAHGPIATICKSQLGQKLHLFLCLKKVSKTDILEL